MRELDIRMIPISSDEMDRLLDESKVEIGVNCGDETRINLKRAIDTFVIARFDWDCTEKSEAPSTYRPHMH